MKKLLSLLLAAALMIGGGIGNLIDRIWRGFVVDYLSLSFFPPVCNFADYCITIGAFLFVIVLLFFGGKDKKQTGEEDPVKETDVPEETEIDEKTDDEKSGDAHENEEKDNDDSGVKDGD